MVVQQAAHFFYSQTEGEQLPHGWTTVQELQPAEAATTQGSDSDPVSSNNSSASSLSTLSVHSLTDSSHGSRSAPSTPPSTRRRHSWTKRGPTPTLCFTRKKKAFDGSINPVVTGLIITTRQKRSVRLLTMPHYTLAHLD